MKKWKNSTKPLRVPEKYITEIIKYAKFLDKYEEYSVESKHIYLFDVPIKIIDGVPYIAIKDLFKLGFKLFPLEIYRLLR